MSAGGADPFEQVWYGHGAAAGAARLALAPLSAAFGLASSVRGFLYRRELLAVRRAPRPVVSVGSLRVGGAGKTPFALWLVRRLREAGANPCLVTRGYGGSATSPLLLEAAAATRPDAASMAGDEAVLLALRSGAPVAVGADRLAACRHAVSTLAGEGTEPDLFVLDDGFQHRALARDLDVVLVTGRERGERLLPAGPLREPARALARADAVVLVGPDEAGNGAPAMRARLRPSALVRSVADATGDDVASLAGRRVAAVAAVARPERFLRDLERLGAEVVATVLRRDHHRYGPHDLSGIDAAAARADLVVTTEKDLVKLAARPPRAPLVALRVEMEVDGGEALVERALALGRFDR